MFLGLASCRNKTHGVANPFLINKSIRFDASVRIARLSRRLSLSLARGAFIAAGSSDLFAADARWQSRKSRAHCRDVSGTQKTINFRINPLRDFVENPLVRVTAAAMRGASRYISRYPARPIPGNPICRRSPARLALEIHVGCGTCRAADDWSIKKICRFQAGTRILKLDQGSLPCIACVLLRRNRLPVHYRYFFRRPQGGTLRVLLLLM